MGVVVAPHKHCWSPWTSPLHLPACWHQGDTAMHTYMWKHESRNYQAPKDHNIHFHLLGHKNPKTPKEFRKIAHPPYEQVSGKHSWFPACLRSWRHPRWNSNPQPYSPPNPSHHDHVQLSSPSSSSSSFSWCWCYCCYYTLVANHRQDSKLHLPAEKSLSLGTINRPLLLSYTSKKLTSYNNYGYCCCYYCCCCCCCCWC